ncbi:DNA topoisomerase IV subunit B [Mycoplasma anatis]|uniref:DNA topoisomerase (ATP-hydrolyzing) n=1 Tax=Mycoplasmopsis anatis TaxID=171279 RepID=A0A9Q3L8I3_9BACT|nr:DNA topoisomerase IV subunit B [Mycoplasmopsis anatis]MBW0595954.1 DNA topoisomerase IV subunit B [Mycoplasmopsis anatis]MBW0596673.1 DNA topoisomerase IV subunit B [Mycoplasmopsis anatis]MBW0597394.1 DNA topoisomerase IV subunit B [Mycoplasmopsis anatis]MBW0599409.1 DNA topoisomerase IV subunit B [Mycoplasmopsis anatis]MBW0600247.1 DNA topoisomerase IV subunit B [Mycoplasmopsis anatis]
MQQNSYTEKDIKKLNGLEAVRKRPGMYIGGTDVNGLHHLVWEIVDNSIDEALAGYANKIIVTINKDSSVSIEDNGRGIPVGKTEDGRTAVELVFTELHAGGKFSEGAYKSSGGLHGVGSSVVNALSSKLDVTVFRDGQIWYTEFEQDKIIKRTSSIGKTNKNGTIVHFMPDYSFFKKAKLNTDIISERLKESSFLISSLEIVLNDEINQTSETFKYDNGIKEFVNFVNDSKTPIIEPFSFKDEKNGVEVEFGFQYTDTYNELILSFVNNVKTRDGGTHETGFKSALTKVFNSFAEEEKVIKGKNTLEGSDIREGLTAIISLKVPENILEFVGQTKDKLGTPEAKAIVEDIVTKFMKQWITENKQIARKVLEKIKRAYEIRNDERKRKNELRQTKNILKTKQILSDKLTPAQSKKVEEKELFLVEGDSAGGTAKTGRDRRYQAILPLRGKVLNTEKSKLLEILKNVEINTIINTIGAGYGKDFDVSKAQYGKIIIMTDADTDGAHIQILLLTFLYRYMRPLIEDGRVFIARPPLYKITSKAKNKNEVIYAWDDDELKEILEKINSYEIQRYKGLGEMNADQIWDTTMNPKTRTIIKVDIKDASLAERRVTMLMGDNVQARREWIDKNVDFSTDDDFALNIDN